MSEMTKANCHLTGSELRQIVFLEMVKKGIDSKRINNFLKIYWPKQPKIIGTSIKVKKSEKENVLTGIIYLAPWHESIPFGGSNMCSCASFGCAKACLGKNSRRLSMCRGLHSKIWKTLLLLYRPDIFKAILFNDLRILRKRAVKKKMKAACRPNGCSDYLWEKRLPELFTTFPDIQFYDYTKIEKRFYWELPPNYHLTFSRTENNDEACERVLRAGFNVAIVFADLQKAIESGFYGKSVYDADNTDYRPNDPNGIAGLSVKARAKDDTGFIVKNVS